MDTKTQEKTEAPKLETPVNGGALAQPEAVRGDLVPGGTEVIVWTRERIDLIKKEICPAGITDSEFALFIERCRRAQMDPLMDEAYCVPRRVKVIVGQDDRGYDIEKWITKHVFQGAEKGMAARADRFSDFEGIESAAVYSNDQIEIDPSAGTVSHKFKPNAKDRGNLIGAWAKAYRKGRHLPVVWVDFEEYVQRTKDGKTTQMWNDGGGKPETMIEKCARAAAYRRAYPNTLGGVYIKEEMRDEREVNAPPRTAEQEKKGGRTRTESMTEKVQQRAAASRPAGQQTVDAPKTDAPKDDGPTAKFGGELKHKPLRSLSYEQLLQLVSTGDKYVQDNPSATYTPQVTANLVEIEREIAAREAKNAEPSEPPELSVVREVGADDGAP